uniref:Laccase n=1 Tax=Kalanchoe fedtschenkoi TaxID=63787 RepID=A0A7N0SXQ3_KALFE
MDALIHTNQKPGRYYMAARAYSSGNVSFDNTTTTAIIQYRSGHSTENCNETVTDSDGPAPLLPQLPDYNDTRAFLYFVQSLRSLASHEHPCDLPQEIDTNLVATLSVNAYICGANNTCEGPNGTRFAASMNNISFNVPSVDILEAYYYQAERVFTQDFPPFPPLVFNFTAEYLPLEYEIPQPGTRVLALRYNSTVEMVFQGTNVVGGIDHPMHLHGYNFYIVGSGLGNFNPVRDPLTYNLVDPPQRNTVIVPINGWTAIRFRANNPGVWFMHCHLERHMTWGMDTVILVKNGGTRKTSILPPPDYMPPCTSDDYFRFSGP